jgi:hypothetical protein
MADFEDELRDFEIDSKNKDFNKIVKEADTPEKAAALTEALEEEPETTAAPEKDTATDTVKDTETKTTEAGTEIKTDTDGDKTQKDTSLEAKVPFVIDDAYIAKADPKDRTLLESVKGETMSEKALNRYLNAERKIGQQGNEIGQLKKQVAQPTEIQKPIPDTIPKQEQLLQQQVKTHIQTETDSRLKAIYPDLPSDPEDRKFFLSGLRADDPERYDEYREDKKRIQIEVETDTNQALYKINNRENINNAVYNNEILNIKNQLKECGIEDPKSLGFDLDLQVNPDGSVKNELLNKMLIKNGQYDPELVEMWGDKPALKEKKISKKFFELYAGQLFKAASEQKIINAKKEAIEAQNDLKKKAPNSATNLKSAGSAVNKDGKLIIKSISDIPKLGNTPETAAAITKMLEQDI